MRKRIHVVPIFLVILFVVLLGLNWRASQLWSTPTSPVMSIVEESTISYWFLLKRTSNIEYLYYGIAGNEAESELVKAFTVKSGIPGEKPTPLPQLTGRDYWIITDKFDARDYPETAPYFLKIDVPVSDEPPYGPVPYEECGGQCDWELPGAFGLHGVAGDTTRLSVYDPGSSGCIRHSDEDITYLYHLLDPKEYEIRYYINDL